MRYLMKQEIQYIEVHMCIRINVVKKLKDNS
jgi:hypothetical protein